MRTLAALVLVLGFAARPAYAQNESPDCHGQNQEECREDPQPDHGMDCERSDDHRDCATTTTTATLVATTTTAAPTTTTTASAQVSPAPVTEVQGVTETRPETLPRTGAPVAGLVALGLFACLLGLLAAYAGRERPAG